MRWVSYTRAVSNRKGAENPPNIISLQNGHIDEYMKKQDLRILKKYSDRKFSPDTADAFDELVQAGMRREYDGVVMDSVFRFGVSFQSAADILLKVFYPADIKFAVAEDDFCSSGKTQDEVRAYIKEKRSRLSEIPTCYEREWELMPKRGTAHRGGRAEYKLTKKVSIFAGIVFDRDSGNPVDTFSDEKVEEAVKAALIRLKLQAEYANESILEGKALACEREALEPFIEKVHFLFQTMDEESIRRMKTWQEFQCGKLDSDEYEHSEQEYRQTCLENEAELSPLMAEVKRIQTVYSVRNPWIRKYRNISIPDKLEKGHIRRWVHAILIDGSADDGRTVTGIEVTGEREEWRKQLPPEWFSQYGKV